VPMRCVGGRRHQRNLARKRDPNALEKHESQQGWIRVEREQPRHVVREIWHRVVGIKKTPDLNDRELTTVSILAWGSAEPLRAMLDRAGPPFDAEPFSLAAIPPRQLLRAHPELCLEGDVAGTLCRSQESREIFLLRFDHGDALLLQAHSVVEEIAYVLLVRLVSAGHLHAKLTPRIALLRHQLIHLRREARVGLFELSELSICKSEFLLSKLRRLRAKLLLERRAPWIRRRVRGLAIHHWRDEQTQNAEAEQAFDHRVP